MKTWVLKSLMRTFSFLFVLALTVPGSWAATANTFILSDEGATGLITRLDNAGYGDYNLYAALVAIQADTNPSVAGIITPLFLATLQSCPVNSPIFTTQLKNIPAGSSLAISDDCTEQVTSTEEFGGRSAHGESYFNQPGNTTLPAAMSGVSGLGRFTHSTTPQTAITTFQTNGNTYNVFAIDWENHGSQTLILSDEAPGNLITKMDSAGYGLDNLYQALVDMVASTNPSVSGIITPTFLQSLQICPTNSTIFTTQLKNIPPGSLLAISTDCTEQLIDFLDVRGATYYKQAGTATLGSDISGVGRGLFTHSIDQSPLLSYVTDANAYYVFAIGWAGGQLIYLPIITR